MNRTKRIRKLHVQNPIINLIASTLFLSVGLCNAASGQKEFGFSMPSGVKRVEIDFEEYNNLIVIPVTINHFLTLKFILDTGVETTILTEKLFADLLDTHYIRELKITGPGIADSVEALVANAMTFYLPGGLIGKNMNMLVLKEDYLELSATMGEEIYGIIGYDIFSRFTVEIDYDNQKLILHDPKLFKPKRRYIPIPIEIKNSKPYLKTHVAQKEEKNALDIMVDTGASHAILLDFGTVGINNFTREKIVTQLGRGIAGEIPGYLSRLDTLVIGKFSFENVLFSTPFEGAYNKNIKRGSKYGTIGGEILHRFHLTMDYRNQKIYLRKSTRYHNAFEHDMSGLTIHTKGENLDTLEVVDVKDNSPANLAGIYVGDVILRINSKNLKYSTLSDINAMLRKKEGLKIRCKIARDNEIIKKTFYLKRMI